MTQPHCSIIFGNKICFNMTFDRLTFQLSNSAEQLGNLSEVALSTLFINLFGSFMVDLMSKLTIDQIDDLELNKRSHFRWMYVCVLVRFNLYYSVQQHIWHFEKNGIMKLQPQTNSRACFKPNV